jgi:hypothetical protein
MRIPILHEDFIPTETRRIKKQRPTPVLSVHGVLAAIKAAQFIIEDAGEGVEDSSGAGHELLTQDGGEGLLVAVLWNPVLRIHDILGWIRIRTRGSMSLTNFLTQFFLLITF